MQPIHWLRRCALIPLLVIAAAGLLCAQATDETQSLSPRQLFYAPKKSRPVSAAAAKPATPPKPKVERGDKPPTPPKAPVPPKPEHAPYLGLRYSIRQLQANDSSQEVNPSKEFRSGDRIRLDVRANDDAYLYVVHQGSDGNWDVLFPSSEESSSLARADQSLVIPQTSFVFDDVPGKERLFLILSRTPEQRFDDLIRSVRKNAAGASERTLMAQARPAISNSEVDRLRQGLVSRNLRVEKRPTSSSGKREEAVYVVNTAGDTADQRVVAEIELTHR